LDKLGYATRKQLQVIHRLGSDRNAQRFLTNMEDEGFIKSNRYEMKVYSLTTKGKNIIGSNKEVTTNQLEHNLMRNDLYIFYQMPLNWRSEAPIQFNVGHTLKENGALQADIITIIPDATFQKENKYFFIEVDHTQSLQKNKKKIEKYAELDRKLKRRNERMELIFYTLSSIRKKHIEMIGEKEGIKITVYTREDIVF
jgi:hypothetical protein